MGRIYSPAGSCVGMSEGQADEPSESFDSDSYDETYDTDEENSDDPDSMFSPCEAVEHGLQVKNAKIVETVKDLTVNNLTPATKRKLTQQEELRKAEQEATEGKQPVWLEQATRRRTTILQMEERRERGLSLSSQSTEEPRPEWIQKAKEAQISRDLRGLDRFLNQKAPALPAEPEWLSKACKRRDLSKLLQAEERAHESNKETPEWASSAQKILNSFLQDDEGVLPEWMKKGVQMTKAEKTEMMEQLQALKQLLLEEQKLTAERETLLASCKDSLSDAQQRLEESVTAFRTLRDNRKDQDNVQSLVESTNQVFEKNNNWMRRVKDEFEIHEQVQALVDRQQEKEQARRENRTKVTPSTKTKKKLKRSKKKSTKPESSAAAETSHSESANDSVAVTDSPRKKKSKKSSGADLRKKTKKNVSENTS